MSDGYLELLDELLAAGAGFSRGFIDAQVSFVEARQQADGGFAGRMGDSDPYYTDFALRILALLAPSSPAIARAGAYLAGDHAPRDLVEAFSLLHGQRLLRTCGQEISLHGESLLALVQRQALPGGGFARTGGTALSAYATFLAALCRQMLEQPLASAGVEAVRALRQADGGFSESPGETAGQTNATAAAVATLLIRDALTEDDARAAIRFLTRMHAPNGGFRAHAGCAESDLLSTFTATMTLAGLGGLAETPPAAIARFLRALALPAGGFRAAHGDAEADVEYTYYGIGTLAMLRVHAA